MSFPNSSLTDIVVTTLEKRSKRIQDNVTNNNPLLAVLEQKGNTRKVTGGRTIIEEFSFAENANGGYYSGYDILPVAQQDVISGAEFALKQIAVPVTISGLEELQNSGEEALIDLLGARMKVAESTMRNIIEEGLFSDGTGSSGKEITGLDAAVPQDPTTGTYGGINRALAANAFWRSQLRDSAATPTSATIQAEWNALYAACTRGSDRPDLIVAGSTLWLTYLASLQSLQRFTDPKMAKLGFDSVQFMSAAVVNGGGIGGEATATDALFLNTNYLHWRPHARRNMVPLKPRQAVNQDAEVGILAFAGNLTCSGAKFQGRHKGD